MLCSQGSLPISLRYNLQSGRRGNIWDLIFWLYNQIFSTQFVLIQIYPTPDTSWRQRRPSPPCPWSLPWCPWNAPVNIYNFLMRKCLGALSPFQKRSNIHCVHACYLIFYIHFIMVIYNKYITINKLISIQYNDTDWIQWMGYKCCPKYDQGRT